MTISAEEGGGRASWAAVLNSLAVVTASISMMCSAALFSSASAALSAYGRPNPNKRMKNTAT